MIKQIEDFLRKNGKSDELKNIESIYPDSIYERDGSSIFLANFKGEKTLIILGKGEVFNKFQGDLILDGEAKLCPLNHGNAKVIREILPFTAPKAYKDYPISIGLGDRLGLASPGHLRLTKDYDFFPVLAQQSIRELDLTGRTYEDVLDAATWAVLQEGYENGYGFDGDHLKKDEEIQMALDKGATMITLDLSDYIRNDIYDMGDQEVEDRYKELPSQLREELEVRYLGQDHKIDEELTVSFTDQSFKRNVLIYLDGINYGVHVYEKFIKNLKDEIDYEISIDETLHTTTIEAHYFVARALLDRGVKVRSMAPRFVGEFQKGIDYIGNLEDFKKDFIKHLQLSDHFNYKLSIHSGSDKFSVFPTIGEYTGGYYHLKTAGTNWLVAVQVIADKDPQLFREIYDFAFKNLDQAKKYYHVNVGKEDQILIENMKDQDLVAILKDDNMRQILHITYGLILQAKDEEGKSIFKDRIYASLHKYEDEYYKGLYDHIGRHLDLLGIKKK